MQKTISINTDEKSVALMQPMFLPWLGYFELITSVDTFILLDDFNFSRQGWGQRNKIFLSPEREGLVTLPIKHPGSLNATFIDIIPIPEQQHWREKLLRTVKQTYGRSPYFKIVFPLFEAWIGGNYDNIADMSLAFINISLQYLEFEVQILCSSQLDYNRAVYRSAKVASILYATEAKIYRAAYGSFTYMKEDGLFPIDGIHTYFQNHIQIPYKQMCSKVFVPRLSALDAMFNCSVSKIRELIRGTCDWLTWDSMVEKHLNI